MHCQGFLEIILYCVTLKGVYTHSRHLGAGAFMKSLKDLVENQERIREQLYEKFKENPQSMRELARKIGISPITLKRFLLEAHDVDYMPLLKIVNWLER